MAITVGTPALYTPSAAFTGQIVAPSPLQEIESAFEGTVTLTLDGAATTATVNFIDGTNAPFSKISGGSVTAVAPSAVVVTVTGGTQPAAAFISVSAENITTTGFTIRLSAAGTNTNTLIVAFSAKK